MACWIRFEEAPPARSKCPSPHHSSRKPAAGAGAGQDDLKVDEPRLRQPLSQGVKLCLVSGVSVDKEYLHFIPERFPLDPVKLAECLRLGLEAWTLGQWSVWEQVQAPVVLGWEQHHDQVSG